MSHGTVVDTDRATVVLERIGTEVLTGVPSPPEPEPASSARVVGVTDVPSPATVVAGPSAGASAGGLGRCLAEAPRLSRRAAELRLALGGQARTAVSSSDAAWRASPTVPFSPGWMGRYSPLGQSV